MGKHLTNIRKGYSFGNVRPIFCRAWILWRYPRPYPGQGASSGSERGRFHLVYPTLGEFFLWCGIWGGIGGIVFAHIILVIQYFSHNRVAALSSGYPLELLRSFPPRDRQIR